MIDTRQGPARVYVGRNVTLHDKETAIDIMETRSPVVISHNTMWGYSPDTFSRNGDGIRMNDDGDQGPIWVVCIDIHDSTRCIGPTNWAATTCIVGNELHDSSIALKDVANFVIKHTIFDVQESINQGEAKNNLIVNPSRFAIRSKVTSSSHNLV